MMNKLKRFDMFGEQIKLTYKGDYKYRTKLGALMTIIFLVLVLTYASFVLV